MLKYADLPNNIWGRAVMHAVSLKNRCPSTRLNLLSPLQFRTGMAQDFTKLRVFGCPAQIFVRPSRRENSKLSNRSEKGTLIGMSKAGNGYIFKIQRTNQVVEIDSKDVKFNETFSDCMDRKGKNVKGGRVLDPDLFNVTECRPHKGPRGKQKIRRPKIRRFQKIKKEQKSSKTLKVVGWFKRPKDQKTKRPRDQDTTNTSDS